MEASGGGETLGYAYDALGRLLSETQGLGTVAYQYNPAGRRTRAFYPGDGNFSLAYVYDWSGSLTKICVKSTITNCKTETAPAVGFSYDDLGRRVSVMRGNGVETAWGYDGASRLASLAHDPSGTGDDQAWEFDHNPAGQIVAQTAALAGWGWAMGADTSEAYTANGLNQHLTVAGASVSHDARGNMTDDGLGRTFGYDAANRLTSVSGGASATLAYDPAGRLREVAGTATTRFLYDGADVIAEYDETDALLRRYVHGPGLDEPLVWYEGTGTGDRRFLLSDPRGSVVAVTDGAGDVTDVNKYDDYGAPASTNIGRFQFTGQMWLEEAGLYHYKARAYHPALGRFMQADPIGYGDGMNMYAYVGNDPVNFRDPSGMCGTRLSVESSSAMCMLICANPADCYTSGELARRSDGVPIGGGAGGGGGGGGRGPRPESGFIPGSSSAEDFGDEIVVTASRSTVKESWPNGSSLYYAIGLPGAIFASATGDVEIRIQNQALEEAGIQRIILTGSRFQHIKDEHAFERRLEGTEKSTFNYEVLNYSTDATRFFYFLVPGFVTAAPMPNTLGRSGYRLSLNYGGFSIGKNGYTGASTSTVIVVIDGAGGAYEIVTAFPE